jgi:hypothetical protein
MRKKNEIANKNLPDRLVAVQTAEGKDVCVACAEKLYPDGLPDDATPVFDYDEWKMQIAGPCGNDCGAYIDPSGEA